MLKSLIYFAILVLLASSAYAQTYNLEWYVIGSGGGQIEGGGFGIDGTIGQPIVGEISSTDYTLHAGFWVPQDESAPGCTYVIGDANNSHTFTGLDVTYSVRYFKGGPVPPYSCVCPLGGGISWYVSGDVNGSCSFTGLDVTYMVRYFKGGAAPIPCHYCPPLPLLTPPASGVQPTTAIQPKTAPTLKIKGVNKVSD
jgi:hypothetical protein